MSRRQVMIPERELPGTEARLSLFTTARELFMADGLVQIGIDHFARPADSLARARDLGRLRRNFQGYTDDRSEVLIGLGASSISRFPQGYAQNVPATGAYTAAIRDGRMAVARGHVFTHEDAWRGRMIEALMCDFRIDLHEMTLRFGLSPAQLQHLFAPLVARFGGMIRLDPDALSITPQGRPLTRVIAQQLDGYATAPTSHSHAI